MSPDKLWKAAERRLCKMLGGTRRGPTGRDDSDCVHEWLAVEVKCNKKMPKYIMDWMVQASRNSESGHLPIVVWHYPSRPYKSSIVMLRLGDFLDWFGNGDGEPMDCNHSAHNWNREEDGSWICRGCGEPVPQTVVEATMPCGHARSSVRGEGLTHWCNECEEIPFTEMWGACDAQNRVEGQSRQHLQGNHLSLHPDVRRDYSTWFVRRSDER